MTYISLMQRAAILVLGILLLGCKKEPTTWNTSNSAPLLKASLGIYDLIEDSLLETGDDNIVSLVYSNNIVNFGVDSLVEVEEDTIINSFSIFPVSELIVNSGQQFFNQSELIAFDQVDAALTRAIIGSGNLKLRATSDIAGDILFKVVIPEAKRNGSSFEFEGIIPAGSSSSLGILDESAIMDAYDLDLRGASGSAFNEMEILYSLSIPEYEEEVTIFSFNEVSMEISFEGLEMELVEGFLGSEEINFNEKTSFGGVPELNQALINLSAASLELSISNGFGVDLQSILFQVKAENSFTGNQTDLSHSTIGSLINLNRAELHQGQPKPSEKSFLINPTNSNILDFLEVIPDSLSISGKVELNPFGNISNYNDFASSTSSFICTADLEIPLNASFSNLVLSDTSSIDWSDETEVQNAILYLHASSSFPVDASISLIVKDASNNQLIQLTDYIQDDLPPIISGSNSSATEITTLAFELGEKEIDALKRADKIHTELRFETTNYPDLVEIRSTDKIDVLISADVNAQLEF